MGGTRGNAVSFGTRPWPSREFYQWQVVEADVDRNEFWIVSTTRGTAELRKQKPPQSGAVGAQNCLGAYHIRESDSGGTHVQWTQQINTHPWFLSSDFVFNFIWGKQVEHCNGLAHRASMLAESRGASLPKLA